MLLRVDALDIGVRSQEAVVDAGGRFLQVRRAKLDSQVYWRRMPLT